MGSPPGGVHLPRPATCSKAWLRCRTGPASETADVARIRSDGPGCLELAIAIVVAAQSTSHNWQRSSGDSVPGHRGAQSARILRPVAVDLGAPSSLFGRRHLCAYVRRGASGGPNERDSSNVCCRSIRPSSAPTSIRPDALADAHGARSNDKNLVNELRGA